MGENGRGGGGGSWRLGGGRRGNQKRRKIRIDVGAPQLQRYTESRCRWL